MHPDDFITSDRWSDLQLTRPLPEIDSDRLRVAEHGIEMLVQAVHPGVTEVQLWALLNYTNLANNGDWHDGRMLASGPRTNPWLQEASTRRIEAGERGKRSSTASPAKRSTTT